MAAPPSAADPLEGMEDHRRKRHNLRIRGIAERHVRKWGGSSKGYWRVAGSQVLSMALPNAYWEHLGLKTLTQTRQRLGQTA